MEHFKNNDLGELARNGDAPQPPEPSDEAKKQDAQTLTEHTDAPAGEAEKPLDRQDRDKTDDRQPLKSLDRQELDSADATTPENTKEQAAESLDDHELVIDAPDSRFDPMEATQEAPLQPSQLGYQEGEITPVEDNRSDLRMAQDDLNYANQQEKAYDQAVTEGRAQESAEIRQGFADARQEATNHIEDIQNGQKYSYDSYSDYWQSPEGAGIAGEIGSHIAIEGLNKIADMLEVGSESTVSDAAEALGDLIGQEFLAQPLAEAIGKTADFSQELMGNAYEQYGSQAVKDFRSAYPLRDLDGNPVDAAGNRPGGADNEASFWHRD